MARVLVLGAGGIGCELLKNLVISDLAKDIVIVDMDVIELSNLNRQFMFGRSDIGRSKAEVSVEWVTRHFPLYRGRINALASKIEHLPAQFYSSFHLILSGLDSVQSRRWINNIIAELRTIPLIDTGSEGYSGHVMLVIPSQTACIECLNDLFVEETFAMCTLAGAPRSIQHCIQWAAHFAWTQAHSDKSLELNESNCLNWLSEKAKEWALQHSLDAQLISTDLVKQTLDRTIPALSTTNSIVAGLAIMLTEKILSGEQVPEMAPNFYSYNGQCGAYFNHLHLAPDPCCLTCSKVEQIGS
jgi:ubiquitin-activating enzyme E1 C